MIPSQRFPLALACLTLTSALLGLLAPPFWQYLPAAGGVLLLVLAARERLRPARREFGLWQHPLENPVTHRAGRRPVTLHLLIDSQAPQGHCVGQQARDQVLGFWRTLAAGGNDVRLYELGPALRLSATATPNRPSAALGSLEQTPSSPGELKAALAMLCRLAHPGSVILIVTPVEDATVDWLARLDHSWRGLDIWLVSTASRIATEPARIHGWRSALRYAAAWQTQIHHERLAARLDRLGIRWLPANDTRDLHTRLLQRWEADGSRQIAD